MKTLILLPVFFFVSAAFAEVPVKTSPMNQEFTIDYSKSENLGDKKNIHLVEKIKKIAHDFAKENSVYSKPVEYDSINNVLNPVVGSAKYKYSFRFNLKATDGEMFNCLGISDAKLESKLIGCYQAIR